jgi:hypothetical protein
VHASERTDDLYASIDLLSHKLAQSFKKHNEKLRTSRQSSASPPDADTLFTANLFDEEELLQGLDQKYRPSPKVPTFLSIWYMYLYNAKGNNNSIVCLFVE